MSKTMLYLVVAAIMLSPVVVAADEIVTLAREVAEDKPSVIFHFGYRGASYTNEIYQRRSIMILNTLVGSVEAKGGFFFKKGPGEAGRRGLPQMGARRKPADPVCRRVRENAEDTIRESAERTSLGVRDLVALT